MNNPLETLIVREVHRSNNGKITARNHKGELVFIPPKPKFQKRKPSPKEQRQKELFLISIGQSKLGLIAQNKLMASVLLRMDK